MKKNIYVLGALLFFVCAGAAYFFWNYCLRFPQNEAGDLTALTAAKSFRHIPTKKNAFCVSLAQYDEDSLLMAQYNSGLQLVNRKTGEMKEIKPENLDGCGVWGGDGSSADRKVWNPTGLHYDRRKKLLYIANYTGHNLLIGRITDKGTFAAEKMIVAEGLTSPENVAVNEDGSRIAVADYDGNSIFLFDGDGRLRWKKDVPLAHGVEISGSSVYGTSLSTREIIRFDLDGNEIRRVGRQANRGTDGYMWPTALKLYKDKLIVTDPHTGRLTVLDDKLDYVTALGANGPYVTNFNYPYATIVVDNRLYVADTFANRILEMDMEGNLLAQISQDPPRMQPMGSVPYVPSYPYDTAYLFEVQPELPPSFFCEGYDDNKEVVAGFSSFWLVQGNDKIQIPLIDYPTVSFYQRFFVPCYFYNMWFQKVSTGRHEYYILGSPQSTKCIAFIPESGFGGIFDLGETNVFCVQGKIIGDQSYWDNMLHDMDRLTDAFVDKVETRKTRHTAYLEVFAPYYLQRAKLDNMSIEAEMESWLEFQCSQSEAGAELYEAVRQGTFTADDYRSYVEACFREPYKHSVFERLLLRTFAGAAEQSMRNQKEKES